MMSGRSKFPFTATQWQELEHQALIFKYMVSGMPIPPDLLFTVKKSLDSSLSSKLFHHHQPQQMGWNCFQMGFGGKFDPEPGRCRRTDGKKWRCSKEAYPDSKYCERHMHRGRNRSRKPVEAVVTTNAAATTTNNYPLKPPGSSPTTISSISKNPLSPPPTSSLSSLSESTHHFNHPFLYPDHTSQGNTTRLLLDSGPCSVPERDYRYGYGMKEEVDEHAFFSESPGTVRRDSGSSMEDHHPWQLTMGSSMAHLKQRTTCSGFQTEDHHYQILGSDQFRCERDDSKPQKVMHHFLDEWPGERSNFGQISTTQLSISIPNSSNDLFTAAHGGH